MASLRRWYGSFDLNFENERVSGARESFGFAGRGRSVGGGACWRGEPGVRARSRVTTVTPADEKVAKVQLQWICSKPQSQKLPVWLLGAGGCCLKCDLVGAAQAAWSPEGALARQSG